MAKKPARVVHRKLPPPVPVAKPVAETYEPTEKEISAGIMRGLMALDHHLCSRPYASTVPGSGIYGLLTELSRLAHGAPAIPFPPFPEDDDEAEAQAAEVDAKTVPVGKAA